MSEAVFKAVVPSIEYMKEFINTPSLILMSTKGVIACEWMNWAIDYVGSDLPYTTQGNEVSLNHAQVLKQASEKYAEIHFKEGSNTKDSRTN